MKKIKNPQSLKKENFKLYDSLWDRKLLKPSPMLPTQPTPFDTLLYVAAIIDNQNKPQTVENKNCLNHLESSPFRPVNSN